MQPAAPEISTCSTCGGPLEKTPDGGLGCISCLLRVGIGGEEEVEQDSTPNAFGADDRFRPYEIERRPDGSLYELGRGAMGVTYRATDTTLQRKVALKIIKIDGVKRSVEARERFMREARAAAALRHENIATVYQFGIREETGQYFYAMELIEGETLDERVHRAGPLDARATIDIAQQVTSALAAAEQRGLVHRDLKPANLMLVSPDSETANTARKDEKPLVKIIDFGLAKALNAETDPQSLTHDRFVGTPAFASPEQFEHSTLDVRSDIYSLGETLWFALTGKTPFPGHSLEEIHRAQQSNALPIEQLKAAHVPHRVRSLLESMLALGPAARPSTHDLAARLQRCSAQASGVRRTRVALAAAFMLIVGLSAFLVLRSVRPQNFASSPPAAEKSIAVLPFENLSRDPNNAYFADGIQGEILTRLAIIADLRVISRTSTQYYQSKPKNLGEAVLAKGSYYYYCLKEYDIAVRYFEQARQLLPNSSRIPELLAYLARRRGQWDRSEAYFNEAERLDPLSVNLLVQRATNYVCLRRFPEALRKFDEALNIAPDDLNILVQKAAIAQAQGDLPHASALLARVHLVADNIEGLETQVYQAILERRPAPVIPFIKEILAKPDPASGYFNGELRFWLGWAQEVAGDHVGARESWRQARSEMEPFLKEQPDNFSLIDDLALINMSLGDKAAALALSERAIAVNPIEKDAIVGPIPIEILARVAAGMGETDRAIAALQKLLSIPYSGSFSFGVPLTPALLRLDPMFDPLRNDPRFQKLTSTAPKAEDK